MLLKVQTSSYATRTGEGMVAVENHSIRVVLIDDHSVFRAGLRMLIESRTNIRIVAEATNREEAVRQVSEMQPDVILLDIDLGDDNGLDVLPELLLAARQARVLLLTGLRDPVVHRRAVRMGAMGVVSKDTSIETVTTAIKKVHSGEVWIERSVVASVLKELVHPASGHQDDSDERKIASLTAREREIVWLTGEGLRNHTIAERLSLSEATVRNHYTSIFNKLDVADRVELVIYAYRHRLAKLPM